MRFRRIAMVVALSALALVGASCSSASKADPGTSLPSAVAPELPDMSSPAVAVGSYLEWVAYSYRRMDSALASATMTPEEFVRVDAYIQLNMQQNRGIEQHLLSMKIRSAAEEETRAVVVATEDWRYRYFTPATSLYDGPEHLVSYETTYSLVRSDGAWLVDAVEASSDGDVP